MSSMFGVALKVFQMVVPMVVPLFKQLQATRNSVANQNKRFKLKMEEEEEELTTGQTLTNVIKETRSDA